jgi:hypothetical protein
MPRTALVAVEEKKADRGTADAIALTGYAQLSNIFRPTVLLCNQPP